LAEAMLDNAMLEDVASKNSDARRQARGRRSSASQVRGERAVSIGAQICTPNDKLRGLLSDEHFSVDGTQIAAWAAMKSLKAKDGSSEPPGSGRNGELIFTARSAWYIEGYTGRSSFEK
jgi:hypothetical protein